MGEYVNKPFKPPRIVGKGASYTSSNRVKRNRNELTSIGNSIHEQKSCGFQETDNATRKAATSSKAFTANVRKITSKKNKTWNSDGFAYLKNDGRLKFYDDSGNSLGSVVMKDRDLYETVWRVGSNECQIDYEITEREELESVNVTCQMSGGGRGIREKDPVRLEAPKTGIIKYPPTVTRVVPRFKPAFIGEDKKIGKKPKNHIASEYPGTSILPKVHKRTKNDRSYLPVFDSSTISDPLIMNRSVDDKVSVVVDPILSKFLRPHQREGVKFLYDCVMGLSHKASEDSLVLEVDSDVNGCLLADEMGLGKTLMTITLLWTLLKQTPCPTTVSQSGMTLVGVASKVLIVCPVTLINNWKREFKKWLPVNRIGVLTLNTKNTVNENIAQVKSFLNVPRTYQILIIGYERLLTIGETLVADKDKLDLLICDEGHRLKNRDSKILKILRSLDVEKKIVLSGTPIQNDLEEFFTIIDFINPGILGTFARFRKEYIYPISRARDLNMKFSEIVLEKGQSKSQELIDLTKRFILRRTNEILTEYLPPKMDLIIFCKPTRGQLETFKSVLLQGRFNFNQMSYNSSLGLITLFKKICNSTALIHSDQVFEKHCTHENTSVAWTERNGSGKFLFLEQLLNEIKSSTEEKVVVVSNYTKTLDLIESLCHSKGYSFVRLDGSTSTKERDQKINAFNSEKSIFVFLLSAKSGGVGLNLIGASRLILFDNDWNPSIDLQAMSRIHRDGQTKPCFIYRLVTTGCIDEKILQRQLMKIALSKKFLDDKSSNSTSNDNDLFQHEDLADLFTVNEATKCGTHELICNCSGEGVEFEEEDCSVIQSINNSTLLKLSWTNALEAKKIMEKNGQKMKEEEMNLMKRCLVGYKHIDPLFTKDLVDDMATGVLNRLEGVITYAFVKDGK